MSITVTTEKQFESDIETFLISTEGGYTKGNGTYNSKLGLFPDKLISFVQRTQPREWVVYLGEDIRNSYNALYVEAPIDIVSTAEINNFKQKIAEYVMESIV